MYGWGDSEVRSRNRTFHQGEKKQVFSVFRRHCKAFILYPAAKVYALAAKVYTRGEGFFAFFAFFLRLTQFAVADLSWAMAPLRSSTPTLVTRVSVSHSWRNDGRSPRRMARVNARTPASVIGFRSRFRCSKAIIEPAALMIAATQMRSRSTTRWSAHSNRMQVPKESLEDGSPDAPARKSPWSEFQNG